MTFDCHPRRILHGFIPMEVCKELEFIHKGNSTVGYRSNVFSTTLSHLVATNSSHLIMPFVTLREKIKEQVEQAFGCEYELFIEFTGLISWTRGASIGWHSDDNRPYLKQRHYAAVCYLNSYEEHFSGGLFRFQDGEPAIVSPVAGDVVIYTADSRNIHSVDEILQFYVWKEEELLAEEAGLETNGRSTINMPLSQTERNIVGELKRLFLRDSELANKVLVYWASGGRRQHHFNEAGYSAAVELWEAYSCARQKQLLRSLPLWKTHQSIFTVQFENAAL